MNSRRILAGIILGASTVFLPQQLPVQAQRCTPLNVIGAPGTQVEKSVSPPGTLITSNNWNTDFTVPSQASFRRYLVTIVPENTADYDVQVNLKYNNDTTDRVYGRAGLTLERGNSFTITAEPRIDSNPYQVNVLIGGVAALGNTYRLAVSGCQ